MAGARTPPAFIDSIAEVFAPLLAGVPLAVLECDGSDPLALVSALVVHRVTRLTSVPSLLAAALPALRSAGGLRLRLLCVSGEPFPAPLYGALTSALPGARILNVYGSSETGADCCAFDPVSERWSPSGSNASTVPIGRPLPGFTVAIVDASGAPVTEAGQRGELLVCGPGVAHGYLGEPEQTASRFSVDGDGRRAHLTGDVASWSPRGWLNVFGRTEGGTCKVRGQTVSLSEVEAALLAHPSVLACSTRTWSRPLPEGGAVDTVLVAYVVLCGEASPGALRAHVTQRLPAASVPTVVSILPRLPLLSGSGKVDRAALPEPDWGGAAAGMGMETTHASVEEDDHLAMVKAAFATVLCVACVGDDTNFWDSGGTSLSAVALCTRLRIRLQALLDAPTPAALAPCVPAIQHEGEFGVQPSPKRPRLGPAPHDSQRSGSAATQEAAPELASSVGGRLNTLGVEGVLCEPEPGPPSCSSPIASLSVAWGLPLGACVDAPPLLLHAPPRLVVGSHSGRVVCIQLRSGPDPPALLWEAHVGDRVLSSAVALSCGTRVAVACASGDLVLYSLSDGTLLGRLNLGGALRAPPVVDPWSGCLWIATHSKEALKVATPVGQAPAIAWRGPLSAAVSAPAACHPTRRRVVFATLDGTLCAFDDARRGVRAAWTSDAGAALFAAPVFLPTTRDAHHELVVTAGGDGAVRAFDLENGHPVWCLDSGGGGPIFGTPLFLGSSSLVVGTHDGAALCVRPREGTVAWRLPLGGRPAAALCLVQERPHWVPQGCALIAAALAEGTLVLFSMTLGEGGAASAFQQAPALLATLALPAPLFSQPVAWGSLIALGCRDDQLYGVKIEPAAGK